MKLGTACCEVALFGRTFAAFAFHPVRSARAWQGGERDFMNPLAFGASAAGVYWAVTAVMAALWPTPGSGTSDAVAFWFLLAGVTAYVWVCLTMALMLTGLSRTAAWKALVAGGFAIVVTAFLSGTVRTQRDYGWRPYIHIDVSEREFGFGFQG